MKLLIICDMFPPAFGPRMGYLCKYLKRAGWDINVVSEEINDQTFAFLASPETPVTFVRYLHTQSGFLHKLEWICLMILDLIFHYKDHKIEKAAIRLLDHGSFDGILCSSYRTFPLIAAERLAQRYHLPLVVDLRDIIEQYASNEFIAHGLKTFPWLDRYITKFFRYRLLNDRNKVLRKAQAVTTVSPWHVTQLKQYNFHTHLIYNGYDPELFYPKSYQTDRFIITYTGRLISLATRDPRLLFEAVAKLDQEKKISPDQFVLRWYVDPASRTLVETAATPYGIEAYMEYHDYVPAAEIPEILNKSSILLQLANRFAEDGPKGFMTTKLFESMAVGKPLLCVRSDERYLEEAIKQTQTGLAARTSDEVYDFLLHHYQIWQAQGYTTITANKDAVHFYARDKQAEQFMQLFTKLHKSNIE